MVMTQERYLECLDKLRLSRTALAPILGCHPNMTKRWSLGRAPVPQPVAAWLEACLAVRGKYPEPKPPRNWQRPGAKRK
jgi:hypothetical protein